MKLSKAQEKVITEAKERIDFARTHDFYEWYRNGNGWFEDKSNEEIDEWLKKNDANPNGIGGTVYYKQRYEWNKNGIDYLCHASGATIKKLEKLGLIEIIKDSTGSRCYDFDRIRILNY